MRQAIASFALGLGAASALYSSSSARAQRAQEASYLERSRQQNVSAPSSALELTVGTGYTQGVGRLAPGRAMADVAGPGVGVAAGADYRVHPTWSLGLEGEYQEFLGALNFGARGFASNVGVTLHASPALRGDPWLRLGTGYRLLWDVRPPGTATTLRHGFELARATVGYDLRITGPIALAPEVGAGIDLFLWQSQHGVNSALASGQAAAFFFAGVQGRFDLGPRAQDLRSSLSAAELMQ